MTLMRSDQVTVDGRGRLDADERDRMQAFYRELHADPELSMQEHRTQRRIEAELDRLGIAHVRCGGTGVVATVENGEGPVVAFRADTDGLPIAEQTGLEYASSARGVLADGTDVPVMHGCGHDTHVASLMAAAEVMLRERARWSGTLVLIFQPGEETAAGARAMVDDGLWEKAPRPTVVLGQHVTPKPAGQFVLTSGTAMAMADSLTVTLFGKQSHGSQPHTSIDPIVLGSSVVTRLQSIVSRELDPRESAVVTVGTFHAGLKENIIPETAELTINVRSLSEPVREKVIAAIHRIIRAEAQASGAPEPVIEELSSFPINRNDDAATDRVRAALATAFGAEAVLDEGPRMGSEDFGWLGQSIDVPTVFWHFGGFADATATHPTNHSPHFGPDLEPALDAGSAAVITTLMEWLGTRE